MSESGDESSSSRYFKLGLFVLASVALLVTGVIVLGAGVLFRRTVPAETLVYESVSGLDVGAAVKYRGVPIGKVTDIVFASAKYPESAVDHAPATRSVGEPARAANNIRGILIEISLSERAFPGETEQQITDTAQNLVRRGLRARVTPAGISGQSYVECDILNPADFPPPPINWTPDVLYIPSAPSTIGEVIEAAGQIAADLQKADLRKVIGHFDELTTRATSAVGEVQQLVAANRDNVTRTLTELPETAARLRATADRADAILHDPRVEKGIDGFSGLGASATTTLAEVRDLAHEAQQLLAGEGDDIRSILTDLRRFASDGAALTDDARANPSRLLFGKPPPPDAAPPAQPGQ
jgi:ABC-type transporter Mla subunit MlaD